MPDPHTMSKPKCSVWERLNYPPFNPVEFDGIRIQTGLNSFDVLADPNVKRLK